MRNDNAHFSQVPRADIQRSRFDRSNRHLTTWNAGELIPIYCDEVLPGDTVSMDMASLVRMSTPIFPVMDNAFMDVYFFFVPNRLVWEHWKEFNGENVDGYWTQPTEYNIPQLSSPPGTGWNKGSLADHFELPINVPGYQVSAIPFRGYVKIWNEWFRDENYMPPADFDKDDSDRVGAPREDKLEDYFGEYIPVTSAVLGGGVLPVAKTHDYFTSVLPAPQKGNAVDVPFVSGDMPVTTMSKFIPESNSTPVTLKWKYTGGASVTQPNAFLGVASDGSTVIRTSAADNEMVTNLGVVPNNLWVRLANVDVGTVNELRMAFQIQKLYEADARGGTRYTELLKAHFGVTSPDSRLQRPEYLGGKRIPINIDQVLQTSSTNGVSPQGNTAAFSLTVDRDNMFTKSFTEHGYLFGLACIRTDHTYQQGIDRFWSRKRRFDFYWPALAHIGEQAVLKKEIYCTGDETDENAFGYQEAWADYRYKPSHVTGAFRSMYENTLDSWHYADIFSSDPSTFVANSQFMRETRKNVDRTLAVNADLEDQFFGNFCFRSVWTRPMPVYSVPGLIDHF